jgi:multiple sugar transport system substrate-binding protein
MTRQLILGTASGLALLALAPTASADTLRFTVAEYSAATGPFFEELAAAFEAENPDHDIQIEVVPWDVLLQKLTTDISGGVNADLAIIGTRWLIDFVNEGIATPLDDLMTEELRSAFIPSLLQPAVIDEVIYGLPVAASTRALYYNRDLLEAAGHTEPPATWEEVAQVAADIAALEGDAAGFGLQGAEIETDVYFYYALWSFGGDIIEEDGTSGLDSEAAYRAAELYKSMIDAGSTQPGPTSMSREDVQNLFKQGQVGMMLTAPFLVNQIEAEAPDLNFGIAPVPAGPDGTNFTYGVTDSIVLFENSPNQELAIEFLEFAFSPEWRQRFDAGEGFIPVTSAVAEMPEFADDPNLRVFTGLMENARFAPLIPGWEEIAQITSDALQRIYLGEGEVQATLDEAAAEIDAILAQNQ